MTLVLIPLLPGMEIFIHFTFSCRDDFPQCTTTLPGTCQAGGVEECDFVPGENQTFT